MTLAGDRRALLRWAMAAAIAPVLASRAGAARPALAGGRFTPPAVPMVFTRKLERSLGDGNALSVSRSFAIRFASQPGGWLITGEQVAVAVDFPQRLAKLGALEQQRKETGMFPLVLDRNGRIAGVPAAPQPGRELEQAVALVKVALDKVPVTGGDRADLDTFVRAVQNAGEHLVSLPPDDLFAPADPVARAEQALTLPDGEQGTIRVTFTAQSDPTTGLMRQARREIVTTIAADSRRTREDWTLALA